MRTSGARSETRGSPASQERPPRPGPEPCPGCGALLEAVWQSWVKGGFWTVPHLCPACEAAASEAEQAKERAAKAVSLLAKANLPPEAAGWDFAAAEAAAREAKADPADLALWLEAFHRCRTWHGGRRGLYLYGEAGLGKTILGYCMILAWVQERQEPALFVSVPDFFDAVESDRARAADLKARARAAGLLVLDEVDERRPLKAQRQALYDVVDHRVKFHRPTVYTSNLAPGDLAVRLRDQHGRTIDRIVGSTEGVLFEGESFRRLAARRHW